MEAEGDLLELWEARRRTGHAHPRVAFWRDVWSLIGRDRRPPAVPARPRHARFALATVWQDLIFTGRLFRRQPLFAVLIVSTLALGLTAAITMFTVCDQALFRPLPYPEPDRVVSISDVGFGMAGGRPGVDAPLAHLPEFSHVALYGSGGLNLGRDVTPRRLRAAGVSTEFFRALGVPPALGRTFDAEEERASQPVVVLSDALWRTRFGSDRAVIGAPIELNDRTYTVLGIMPAGFTFPNDAEVWTPFFADSRMFGAAVGAQYIARLSPGVTLNASRDAIARPRDKTTCAPALGPRCTRRRCPLHDRLVGSSRPTLLFLGGLAGLFLLATCANVAGLLLSRLRVREQEWRVRTALGASGSRLAAQLIVECGTIALLGMVAGIGLASVVVRGLVAAVPGWPRPGRLWVSMVGSSRRPRGHRWGGRPALRRDSGGAGGCATGTGGDAARGGDQHRAHRVGAERPGRRPDRDRPAGTSRDERRPRGRLLRDSRESISVLTTTTASSSNSSPLPSARYDTRAKRWPPGLHAIDAALTNAPGAVAAGLLERRTGASSAIGIGTALSREDETLEAGPGSGLPARLATVLSATPGYFRAVGIGVLAGRTFVRADDAAGARVAVLGCGAPQPRSGPLPRPPSAGASACRSLAAPTFTHVIGARERRLSPQRRDLRESGVCADRDPAAVWLGRGRCRDDGRPVPARRLYSAPTRCPRSQGSPLYSRLLIRDVRSRYLATQRLTLTLTAVFAGVALALCAIGLYGVLAQMVAQRTREMGVRIALGARPSRVVLMIVGSGLRMALGGALIGIWASGAAARLIARLVPALDPPSPDRDAGRRRHSGRRGRRRRLVARPSRLEN